MLLELLAALFIFLLSLTGIIGASLSANDLSGHARSTMMAIDDLRDVMERINATAFADIPTDFPDGVADGGGVTDYAALAGGYSLPQEQMTVTYPVQDADRLEIVVTLQWVEQGRQRSLSLSTFRSSAL